MNREHTKDIGHQLELEIETWTVENSSLSSMLNPGKQATLRHQAGRTPAKNSFPYKYVQSLQT